MIEYTYAEPTAGPITMAWNIQLVPDNHSFRVEHGETVLEAALRAGVSVSYGCSNGNCGDCRARVMAGTVKQVRPHDYVFNEAEKVAGYALMCSVTAASDLVLEVNVADGPDQIPIQHIRTSVRGMDRPNERVLILRLQTPRTQRLRFMAGQSVQLRANGGAVSATLPLANCPCDDRNLMVHISSESNDPFAAYCHQQLGNGEPVEVEGPLGDFVLADERPRPLLFLACNTGFAPIRSLVEHVLAQESPHALDLIWAAESGTGHYQENLCRSWQDAIDNFHYHAVHLKKGVSRSELQSDLAAVLASARHRTEHYGFIAGPEWFVQVAKQCVSELRVPAPKFRSLVT
jgi:CDP-4-dehydro-6-deoxyglucose reductase, E3